MTWLRQAGGFWVDPEGNENKVDSHGEWAYQLFLNKFISDAETAEPVVEDKPLAGPKVEYKGMGGEEAKKFAEDKMREIGISSPLQAANKLMDEGWVRISNDDQSTLIVMAKDYASLIHADEAITRAAANADMISISIASEHEDLFFMPADLQMGLAGAIDKARTRKNNPPVQTSGLGSWGSARVSPAVDFFVNVVHKPEAALGKQWIVLNDNGKNVAEGPSRKWAERSARRLGWFKRIFK